MARTTTQRDPMDERLVSGSVKATLDRVNGGNDDGMEWVPRGRRVEESPDRTHENNNDNEKDNRKNTRKNTDEEKKDKVLPSAVSKKTGDKKSGKRQPKDSATDGHSPAKEGGGNYWENFLLKLQKRIKSKKTGKTRVVLMPEDIIIFLQTSFGKHSADVLSILAEELSENERENIRKHIAKRTNLNR